VVLLLGLAALLVESPTGQTQPQRGTVSNLSTVVGDGNTPPRVVRRIDVSVRDLSSTWTGRIASTTSAVEFLDAPVTLILQQGAALVSGTFTSTRNSQNQRWCNGVVENSQVQPDRRLQLRIRQTECEGSFSFDGDLDDTMSRFESGGISIVR